MLSPEVWNFREPPSNFTHQIGSVAGEDCPNAITKISCNHLISVIVPDTLKVPQAIIDALADSQYYKVEELNAEEFVAVDFVKNFVERGRLTALSVNNRIDCDDCLSVNSGGNLVLSVIKDTYQRLGLEGKVSHFHQKTKSRYVIRVNLNDTYHKKYHQRLKQGLSRLKFTTLVKWEPDTDEICPSSIAKYFHDLGYSIKECNNAFNTRTEYSVKVPHINFADTDADANIELTEWLGMVALGCDLESGRPDNFMNTYQTPEPNDVLGQLKILQWRGFFTSKEVKDLFERLRKYVKEEQKMWVALYVQAFSDCPLSWQNTEHHYFMNGDNSYTIIFNDKNYLLCTQKCSNKQYK